MSGTENGRKPNGVEAGNAARDPGKDLWTHLFLERLSPETRAGLTRAQLDDIRRAAREVAPGDHRIDWRFSLPLLGPLFGGRGIYGVLLAGTERRGPSRRQQDRVMRRRARGTGRANVQVMAVGISLALLLVMMLMGALHAG